MRRDRRANRRGLPRGSGLTRTGTVSRLNNRGKRSHAGGTSITPDGVFLAKSTAPSTPPMVEKMRIHEEPDDEIEENADHPQPRRSIRVVAELRRHVPERHQAFHQLPLERGHEQADRHRQQHDK